MEMYDAKTAAKDTYFCKILLTLQKKIRREVENGITCMTTSEFDDIDCDVMKQVFKIFENAGYIARYENEDTSEGVYISWDHQYSLIYDK